MSETSLGGLESNTPLDVETVKFSPSRLKRAVVRQLHCCCVGALPSARGKGDALLT